jgi:hypothetical protein
MDDPNLDKETIKRIVIDYIIGWLKDDNRYLDYKYGGYSGYRYCQRNNNNAENIKAENVVFVNDSVVRVIRKKDRAIRRISKDNDFARIESTKFTELFCKPIAVEIVYDVYRHLYVKTSLIIDEDDGWKIYMTPLVY